MAAVKTTGAEFAKYYADPKVWPDGAYHDREEISVNGEYVDEYDDISGDARVLIECGDVIFEDGSSVEMTKHFRKWKKSQTTAFITIECDKNLVEQIKSELKKISGINSIK